MKYSIKTLIKKLYLQTEVVGKLLMHFGKRLGLRNRSKLVQTPDGILLSLWNKYPWERYERSYPTKAIG